MRKSLFLGLLTSWLMALPVYAKFEVPQPLRSGRSDFISRGLKESCFSLQASDISMGRPCNPAFLGLNEEEKFMTHAFFGNNVRYFKDALDVIEYRADTSTVQRLFRQSSDADFEADLELFYRKNDWTISFSPSRVAYYSLIRNHVLPFVSVYVSHEQVLRAQKSWSLNSDLHLGFQARAFYRQFILSEFFLTDAVVEDSENLLRPRYQNGIYLEPGALWAPSDTYLSPQVSATITQVGIFNRHYKQLEDDPEGELGITISPQVGPGNFRFGPHFSFNSRTEKWEENIRVSGIYEYRPLQFIGSFKVNQGNVGVYYQLERFTGGLIYDVEFIENLQANDEHLTTWYFQFGYEI